MSKNTDLAQQANNGALIDAANTFTENQSFKEITETQVTFGTFIDPANGSIQYKSLTSSITVTGGFENGQSVLLRIADGADYTITWPAVNWVGGTAPVLATTGFTWIFLWKVNGVLYGNHIGDSA